MLIADVLISFSGVFTGVFVKLMENTSVSYTRYVPYVNRYVYSNKLGKDPIEHLCSIPYLIRLKQCLDEYLSSKDYNKRPLINALKYTSCIPAIFLGHCTKNDNSILKGTISNEALLFQLW